MAKQSFFIDIPLYNARVNICLTTKAFLKIADLSEEDTAALPDDTYVDGWALKSTKGNVYNVALIRLSHGVIAHELLHTTFDILRNAGVKYSEKSEEAFSYLHGYLVDEAYRGLDKLDKLKDRRNDRQPEDSTPA